MNAEDVVRAGKKERSYFCQVESKRIERKGETGRKGETKRKGEPKGKGKMRTPEPDAATIHDSSLKEDAGSPNQFRALPRARSRPITNSNNLVSKHLAPDHVALLESPCYKSKSRCRSPHRLENLWNSILVKLRSL